MQYTIRKSGNSLVLTIPTFIAKTLEMKNGTKVDIELQNKKIIIRKENKNEKENTKE